MSSRRRRFVVAARAGSREGGGGLRRRVQARSAEEAVAVVAASRALTKQGDVYEAWPATEPDCVLRITLALREPRGALAPGGGLPPIDPRTL